MRPFIVFMSVIVLLLMSTNSAFAQPRLINATPAPDSLIKDKNKEIQLAFDMKLKQGSSFTLHDQTGLVIPLKSVQLNGNQMKGYPAKSLPNGNIIVNWSVVGMDDHLSQGTFQFYVEAKTSVSPLAYLPLFLGIVAFVVLFLLIIWVRKKSI